MHHISHHISPEMQECLDLCHDCHNICLSTVNHCLGLGGKHAREKHISQLLACAAICETSAELMALGSEHHAPICGVCAQVCRECADDCERIDRSDEHMGECASVCRRCAESCQQMAAGMPAAAHH
jgi:hypothetical protein